MRGSHGQLEHDRTETVLLSRPYHTEADQLQQGQERHYHVRPGRVRCEHAPEFDPIDQVEMCQDEADALPDGQPLPLDLVRRLLRERPPRLTRPMLETLAIIAYRQPCTRLEIEAVRGVDADAVLSTLGERRMIRIVGRKDAPGRPLLYATTREFLETFGLPDLAAMPPLRELGEGAELLLVSDLTVSAAGVVPTAEHEPAPAEENGPSRESAAEGS